MSKSKLIAGLTSVAIFATSLAVAPAASAVQLHSEERSGRPICVATFSDREVQVSKDYFQAQIDEYLKLQDRLRAAYPQFADLYAELDDQIAQGGTFDDYSLYTKLEPLQQVGFASLSEDRLFAFKGTEAFTNFTELAQSGVNLTAEIVPGWTKNEMISYPYSEVSVVAVGGDWSDYETFSQSLDVQMAVRSSYSTYYAFDRTSYSAALRPFVRPHVLALEGRKNEFENSFAYETIRTSANECLASLETGELPPVETVPTTTYAPTVTVTVAPSTVTETPEPTTVTAEPSTIVETPAPVTSTAPVETVVETPAPATSTAATRTVTATPAPVTSTAPIETVVETPAPATSTAATATVTVTPAPVTSTAVAETLTVTVTPEPVTSTAPTKTVTSTAPVETVVETPAPVTSTAVTKTVTVTPAPVTTTKVKETVTVTPEPTTSTAAPETVMETPAPVTSTAATGTTTVTPAPATSTKAQETIVVTPVPATSTATKATVTVTAEPTTITTTPTVTVTAEPVEVTESEEAPEDNKSEGMGMLPIIIAILAALGGIAGFILNSPAILQGLI